VTSAFYEFYYSYLLSLNDYKLKFTQDFWGEKFSSCNKDSCVLFVCFDAGNLAER